MCLNLKKSNKKKWKKQQINKEDRDEVEHEKPSNKKGIVIVFLCTASSLANFFTFSFSYFLQKSTIFTIYVCKR